MTKIKRLLFYFDHKTHKFCFLKIVTLRFLLLMQIKFPSNLRLIDRKMNKKINFYYFLKFRENRQ